MSSHLHDDDIEAMLERLAEDPPTVEEAREALEASGRFEVVEIVERE